MNYRSLVPLFLVNLLVSQSGMADDTISFTRDIRPILSTNCLQCHGPDAEHREADLRLDQAAGIQSAFGDEKGEGLERILSPDEDFQMPPRSSHRELKPAEKALISGWVQSGAGFESHWSFDQPAKRKPPASPGKHESWIRNDIDRYVLQRLLAAGLQPNSEADRERLIRRVTYDLTGLPPTLAEIDAFAGDKSPDAYEKVVDRLLASRAFGERMTLNWLDAARYGDTSVFHADGRRDMWAWRDWVIKAYNDNMPFDQFTIKQLAGDLLPEATWQDRVASAFNRNHGTTDEGGAIAEEYRVEYVVDRVKTTATVWLGLTMECGQCHSHKYDPITQKEYYQFFAFFNQTTDPGMQTRGGNQTPTVQVPNEANFPEAEKLKQLVADLQKKLADHKKNQESKFQQWTVEAARNRTEQKMPGGLGFHWTLDEKKGKTVSDSVDGKRKGTIRGKQLFQPGKIGKAIELDGGSHIDFGPVNSFEKDSQFTLAAWIKWNRKDGAVFSKMTNGGNFRGYDFLISGGHMEFHLINSWPGNALKVRCKQKIKENQWQHLCLTYDGSGKAAGVKIYYDGVNQAWDIQQNGLTGTTITDAPFLVGQRHRSAPLKGLLDDLRVYNRNLSEAEVKTLAGNDGLQQLLVLDPAKRSPAQVQSLRDYYFGTIDKQAPDLTRQIAANQKRQTELAKPLTTVMVMQEMPKPRMTYILDRGHYASPKKDEVIQPGTPAFLPPMKKGLPSNRLGLARWIVDPENPLTARVTVNRYWQMLFGRGLVETAEDFGTQGLAPSHPELLDHLATDFVESGWNIKLTLKSIVMSATYRQSSAASPEKIARDPRNELLSRGSRFRLMGEFIRDGALASAGLLNKDLGGPSVKPYQPPGLWNEVSLNGGLRFKRDSGEKLYRKSMYIYWRRSAPMPSMSLFGTPSREKCVIRRAKTNTPLQALVTLNDEQFVEAARFLAQRVLLDKSATETKAKIVKAYRRVAGVQPSPQSLKLLLQTFAEEQKFFSENLEEAKKLLTTGEMKRDESLDAAAHAAMTIVTGIIMNLDESLTRG
ncbi:MAG: DUF1553 domain-containing protein [Planctomycetota bacterium]|nr:DUF1553 domain-containing protein [Planctomycetota bacterium]